MSIEASTQRPDIGGDGQAERPRQLLLYGIEGSSTTLRARRNLEAALEATGVDLDLLQFVDVLENPQSAYADGVMATPMLVIGTGGSSLRVVGTLDDIEHIRRLLDRWRTR
ncbi:MAG: hypothetical protein TEF_08735 [Rhizobiales bacterium NRL2]|jgi:hypothetical protein|nr:MAG: hypothetical protein TEF_08735 [Rhizobiales bacterium NRL2]